MRELWRSWKWPFLFVLATAPIAIIAFSMFFMAQNELAFDEVRCPFEEGETRLVSPGVSVREDARTCQEDVEEHRWVLHREGQAPREIARRRLEARYFEGDYRWTAAVEEGEVEIEIVNPGHGSRIFREHSELAGGGRAPAVPMP